MSVTPKTKKIIEIAVILIGIGISWGSLRANQTAIFRSMEVMQDDIREIRGVLYPANQISYGDNRLDNPTP